MKKLLKTSTLALAMLSLFTTSCKKEELAAPPATVVADAVMVTWTPENSSGPITTKGDVKDGEAGKDYVLVPALATPLCDNGTWSLKKDFPEGKEVAVSGTNLKTGKTVFRPISRGTYKFTFTYKCPDCKDTSISISITAG